MQKLHNVTITYGEGKVFETTVCGFKYSKKGVAIPLSKNDAKAIAYDRLWDGKLSPVGDALNSPTKATTLSGKTIYVSNISNTTMAQLSDVYRRKLLGDVTKVSIHTITLCGVSPQSGKRDSNGRRVRSRNKKQDTAPKQDTVPVRTLPNGRKVA